MTPSSTGRTIATAMQAAEEVRMTVRVPAELVEAARRAAERQDRSLSAFVRRALADALGRNEASS